MTEHDDMDRRPEPPPLPSLDEWIRDDAGLFRRALSESTEDGLVFEELVRVPDPPDFGKAVRT